MARRRWRLLRRDSARAKARRERDLVAGAADRGEQDGRAGAVDIHLLGALDDLPYLSRLDAERAATQRNSDAEFNREQDTQTRRQVEYDAAVAQAERELTHMTAQLAEAVNQVDDARARIDAVAAAEARHLPTAGPAMDHGGDPVDELLGLRRALDALDLAGDAALAELGQPTPSAADAEAPAADGDVAPGTPAPGPGTPGAGARARALWDRVLRRDGADRDEDDAAPTPRNGVPAAVLAADRRWEGAYGDGHGGMREAPRRAFLALLMAVEVPIQYSIFSGFAQGEGIDDTMVRLLVLAIAIVMIVVPHRAGVIARGRHATGSERTLIRWVVPALMGSWLTIAVVLGYLRAHWLIHPLVDAGGSDPDNLDPDQLSQAPTTSVANLADTLHIYPWTVYAMFIALMTLSGGISFVLGFGGRHPFVAAYLAAKRKRDELAERLADARAARQPAEIPLTWEVTEWEERRDGERDRVDALYRSAGVAYLDGVAVGAADPMVTQAVTELMRRRDWT